MRQLISATQNVKEVFQYRGQRLQFALMLLNGRQAAISPTEKLLVLLKKNDRFDTEGCWRSRNYSDVLILIKLDPMRRHQQSRGNVESNRQPRIDCKQASSMRTMAQGEIVSNATQCPELRQDFVKVHVLTRSGVERPARTRMGSDHGLKTAPPSVGSLDHPPRAR